MYTKLLIFIYASAMLPASLSLWLFGFCSAWYAGAALSGGLVFLAASWFFICRSRRFVMAFSASILYLMFLFAVIVGDICFFQGALP